MNQSTNFKTLRKWNKKNNKITKQHEIYLIRERELKYQKRANEIDKKYDMSYKYLRKKKPKKFY